ncbi:MAG: hypothetical protein N2V77_02565 [Canidatus Methanoxibalbensis ujae]|nr:hypothetical protein [Candidatus Methanoxibalbensis ujae]
MSVGVDVGVGVGVDVDVGSCTYLNNKIRSHTSHWFFLSNVTAHVEGELKMTALICVR